MNIKTLWTDQRASWVAHGAVTLFVPLLLATLPWGQWGSRPLTFAVYATLVAAYYIGARQQPIGGSGTPRVETVAPAAVAATAWVCWMLALLG